MKSPSGLRPAGQQNQRFSFAADDVVQRGAVDLRRRVAETGQRFHQFRIGGGPLAVFDRLRGAAERRSDSAITPAAARKRFLFGKGAAVMS